MLNMAAAQSSTCPINLVLLGEFGSGKSASGNTILGEEKFPSEATADPLTTRCQKAESDVCGRRVTVIDTPDFFDQDLKEPERHVRECREMCKGRECVYLLVIQIGRFTEGERDILEKLENNFGRIRDRTTILFTYGDDLKYDQSIDDYVKNTNPHLQKLIEKCGNRYEVLNNKDRDKEWRGQVERLMGQVCRVSVGENKRGREGQVEGPMEQVCRVNEEENKKGREGKRGVKREEGSGAGTLPETSRHTKPAQSSTCPINLVLLGEFGSGKSASGNTILGEEKFPSEATADPLTTRCQKAESDVCGRRVTVIDTPDFFDQDLKEPERHVRECREMCKGRECVYLLVIQIGRFTEGERDILEKLENKFGRIRDRTIILFTYGDDLKYDQSIDDYVRNTNKHLQMLIQKCGNRYQVFNNKDRDEWRGQVERFMGQVCRVSVGENKRGREGQVEGPMEQVCRVNEEENKKGREGKRGVKREEGSGAGTLPETSRHTKPAQSSTCPINLVLLGEFGSGKSACGNTILGEDKFASETIAGPLTILCQKEERDVCGTRVTVIDTPDFFDRDLKEAERHVRECRAMCKGRECVYLLVIKIGRFTEGERDILERLEKKLGKIRDRTIILFTFGDDLKGQSIDAYVGNTNRHLQRLIKECGGRYQVFNNREKDEQQVKELMRMISRVPLEPERSQGLGQWLSSTFSRS